MKGINVHWNILFLIYDPKYCEKINKLNFITFYSTNLFFPLVNIQSLLVKSL